MKINRSIISKGANATSLARPATLASGLGMTLLSPRSYSSFGDGVPPGCRGTLPARSHGGYGVALFVLRPSKVPFIENKISFIEFAREKVA